MENSPLFVFSLPKWNLKYSDSTIFHRRFVLHWCSHQPEFPLGDFLDHVSNQCLDSGKKSQSGFDFIYLPWDGCVVFLTLESFSIFMEYHSRPCGSGNLLLSPSYFYETTGKSQTRKQWLALFGKVTRRTALRCVFIRHSHTVIHKHGRSPRCLNMRLRKAQKHFSKIRKRLKGLKALLFMSSIMRSQRFLCFNRIPFFPPSAAARSIQFNLIPIKVPLVHTEVI